jgi:hypothetical protein
MSTIIKRVLLFASLFLFLTNSSFSQSASCYSSVPRSHGAYENQSNTVYSSSIAAGATVSWVCGVMTAQYNGACQAYAEVSCPEFSGTNSVNYSTDLIWQYTRGSHTLSSTQSLTLYTWVMVYEGDGVAYASVEVSW